MAAESNSRLNKSATIAFTLPISCQVCLGKVKNPVLCPNNHVFCAPCMGVWLQRNQKCPACRVTMTTSKKILGGLSQQEDDSDKMTNPDLRKARFDLLYKEYENEFEKMQSQVSLLQTENEILKQQVKPDSGSSNNRPSDTSSLLALTKKLQDATKLYDKVKSDLSRHKQENSSLKEENVTLNRENQNLRSELTGRSPHRFARTTVSTLEAKVSEYEKDVTRLNKALERSDEYIEKLKAELETYGKKKTSDTYSSSRSSSSSGSKRAIEIEVNQPDDLETRLEQHRRKLFKEDKQTSSSSSSSVKDRATSSGENAKYYYSRNGYGRESEQDAEENYGVSKPSSSTSSQTASSKGSKRVTFDLRRETNETASFNLEMPSPVKSPGGRNGGRPGSPVKGVLKKKSSENGAKDDTLEYSNSRSYDNYTLDSSKTRLSTDDSLSRSPSKPASRYSKEEDYLYSKGRSTYSGRDDEVYSRQTRYDADESALSEPSDYESSRKSRHTDYEEHADMDDTQLIESELDDLNISLTPEFTDCMKLLNRAEKNVIKHSDSDDEYKPRDEDYEYRSSSKGTHYSPSSEQRPTDSRTYSSALKSDPGTAVSSYRSSLDSYTRGRHVRSGSLDNLSTSVKSRGAGSEFATGLASAYAPTASVDLKSTYGSGRPLSMMGRSPSVDNLMMSGPSSTSSGRLSTDDGKYGYRPRLVIPSYSNGAQYLGEKASDKFAVEDNGLDGAGSQGADTYGVGGGGGVKQVTRPHSASGRLRSYSDLGTSVSALTARRTLDSDFTGERNISTNPTSLTSMPLPDRKSTEGRPTPILLPTNPESHSTVPSSYTKYDYTGSTEVSHKPPSGSRTYDIAPYSSSLYSSQVPAHSSSSSSYGSSSLPPPYTHSSSTAHTASQDYVSTGVSSTGSVHGGKYDVVTTLPSKPRIDTTSLSGTRQSDYGYTQSDLQYGGGRTRMHSDNFGNLGNTAALTNGSAATSSMNTDYDYDKTDYRSKPEFNAITDYSNPTRSDSTDPVSSAKANFASALSSIPGSSAASASSLTFDPVRSSSSSSSYSSSIPYLPTTLTSGTAGSSSSSLYSSTRSNAPPVTYTSSSYTTTRPSSMLSVPMEPIAESTGHYSYVSNLSGDYQSKSNDTFALPEPKKRLFDNSDDLDLSVSPIKSNGRY